MCCFSQLSHLSESLHQIIRVDPFSLFPREISLKVLGYLDAISLGKAAQVSRTWRELADDDLLWRRMCGQHIERKCTRCGWGLPLLERRRLRMEEQAKDGEGSHSTSHHDSHFSHVHQHENALSQGAAQGSTSSMPMGSGQETRGEKRTLGSTDLSSAESEAAKRRRLRCANNAAVSSDSEGAVSISAAAAGPTQVRPGLTTRSVSSSSTTACTLNPATARMARRKPWKHVYCERLMVERNWRKGRYVERILKGHTNGVMCLQVQHNLSVPNYSVLITGSYDKTVKVWNLDTGKVVRTLEGHTRAVRALQFDKLMLVTGSSDRTLRVWNWRTGECLRVLEGHAEAVTCLNYDRNTLASGSADSTVKIWNMATGSCFALRGHTDMVNSVVLWDGKSSPAERAFNSMVDPSPSASDLSHCAAKYLFSASDDGTIKLWDLSSRLCLTTFSGHTGQVQSIKLIVVDKELNEGDSDGEARSNHSSAGSVYRRKAVAVAEAAANAATGPSSGTTACSSPFTPFHPLRSSSTAADSNSGTGSTAAGRNDRAARQDPTSNIPDDKEALLVSGALDNTIKVWDVKTGTERSTLFGHIEGVWAVDVDSLRLASASHGERRRVLIFFCE